MMGKKSGSDAIPSEKKDSGSVNERGGDEDSAVADFLAVSMSSRSIILSNHPFLFLN